MPARAITSARVADVIIARRNASRVASQVSAMRAESSSAACADRCLTEYSRQQDVADAVAESLLQGLRV